MICTLPKVSRSPASPTQNENAEADLHKPHPTCPNELTNAHTTAPQRWLVPHFESRQATTTPPLPFSALKITRLATRIPRACLQIPCCPNPQPTTPRSPRPATRSLRPCRRQRPWKPLTSSSSSQSRCARPPLSWPTTTPPTRPPRAAPPLSSTPPCSATS
jgi:hypothetical protein